MKKLIFVAALAIAACTPGGGTTTISVASVQQALKNACNYELLASTAAADLAALVPTLGPGVVTAAMVADAICKQVNAIPVPAPAIGRMGVPVHGGFLSAGAPILVNGVPVHGASLK